MARAPHAGLAIRSVLVDKYAAVLGPILARVIEATRPSEPFTFPAASTGNMRFPDIAIPTRWVQSRYVDGTKVIHVGQRRPGNQGIAGASKNPWPSLLARITGLMPCSHARASVDGVNIAPAIS